MARSISRKPIELFTQDSHTIDIKLDFMHIKVNDTNIKLDFMDIKVRDTSIKLAFTDIKLRDASIKLAFIDIKVRDTRAKLDFMYIKLQTVYSSPLPRITFGAKNIQCLRHCTKE